MNSSAQFRLTVGSTGTRTPWKGRLPSPKVLTAGQNLSPREYRVNPLILGTLPTGEHAQLTLQGMLELITAGANLI